MSTSVIRIPTAVHQEATRFGALCGEQAGELLAKAWREYVANHREDFAADLEKAAQLIRDESLDELVSFVQDSHTLTIEVDEDELAAARKDPKVRATLNRAKERLERMEREGRSV
jgi:allophanate hydrolase subunit 1